MENIKNIYVIGQRWFDKANGNTYCACKVLINGEHVLTSDWEYGYGTFFLQLAGEELQKKDFIGETKNLGTLTTYCNDKNIKLDYNVADGTKEELILFTKQTPIED